MKNRKTSMKFFDVMDYEKEAEYLTQMHRKGWKFEKVNGLVFYRFTRCEPQDVRYCLDFNPEGEKNPQEYRQMFQDMGWEYVFEMVGYSYFRKPVTADSPEEDIFCDADSHFEMVKRVFRGKMLMLIAIFLLLILPQLIRSMITGMDASAMLTWLIGILYIGIFVKFVVKYLSYKERLEQ